MKFLKLSDDSVTADEKWVFETFYDFWSSDKISPKERLIPMRLPAILWKID